MTNLLMFMVAAFGFITSMAKCVWAFFQPEWIPDIFRRLPQISFRGQPNRWMSGVIFLAAAFACFMGMSVQLTRMID